MTANVDVREELPVGTSWRQPLVVALAVNAVLCGLLLLLVGEVIPPVVVFLVVFGALAVANLRLQGRWPQVVSIVAGLLFTGGNMPFIVDDLAHPDSIAGFAPIWLLVLVTVFVVASAVMVFRRSTASPRAATIVLLALAVIGVAGSAVASSAVDDDIAEAGDVIIAARDVEYPAEVVVPAASDAVLVENHDIFRHTFVVDGQDVKREVPASTDRRVVLDLPPGSYTFRCDVPGHEQMKGTLVLE